MGKKNGKKRQEEEEWVTSEEDDLPSLQKIQRQNRSRQKEQQYNKNQRNGGIKKSRNNAQDGGDSSDEFDRILQEGRSKMNEVHGVFSLGPVLHQVPAEVRSHVFSFLTFNNRLDIRRLNSASRNFYDSFQVLEEVEELVRAISPDTHVIFKEPYGVLLLPVIPFGKEKAVVSALMRTSAETQQAACAAFLSGFVQEHNVVLLRTTNRMLASFLRPREVEVEVKEVSEQKMSSEAQSKNDESVTTVPGAHVSEGPLKVSTAASTTKVKVDAAMWKPVEIDPLSQATRSSRGAGSGSGNSCLFPRPLARMIASVYHVFSMLNEAQTQMSLWMTSDRWLKEFDDVPAMHQHLDQLDAQTVNKPSTFPGLLCTTIEVGSTRFNSDARARLDDHYPLQTSFIWEQNYARTATDPCISLVDRTMHASEHSSMSKDYVPWWEAKKTRKSEKSQKKQK